MKTVEEASRFARRLVDEVRQACNDLPQSRDPREAVVFLYLENLLNLYSGAALLCETGAYASYRALERVMYDTYLRGMWLKYCASYPKVTHAVNDPDSFRFPSSLIMHQELSRAQATKAEPGKFSEFWSYLSGKTHGDIASLLANRCESDARVVESIWMFALALVTLAVPRVVEPYISDIDSSYRLVSLSEWVLSLESAFTSQDSAPRQAVQ
jgi:hypothetical protein